MSRLSRRAVFAGGAGAALAAAAQAASGQVPAVAAERREFGAVGDGVADDTDAVERAFAAALAGRRASFVSLAPGRYRVTRTIRIRTAPRPDGNITHPSGIAGAGATIVSAIADGSPVIAIECAATLRYFRLDGLKIQGSGREGNGLSVSCEKRGAYFYNFCLRDLVIEGCGGDGLRLVGNVFEGQIFNSYLRDNGRNGATFSHGAEDTVLSAVHVFGCVFGGNGRNGADLVGGAADVGFHGCYFLLNKRFGLSAETGCTLLSHCGFENNHMAAADFERGDAGLRLMVFGTLIGCTSYSIHKQTHLVRAFVTDRLVMIGCRGQGGGQARRARLAKLDGKAPAAVSVIGCRGGIDATDRVAVSALGTPGQDRRFGGLWNSPDLARLGEYSLWVDGKGRLRLTRGAPRSDEDGKVVGR
jgi:hypothetical protein